MFKKKISSAKKQKEFFVSSSTRELLDNQVAESPAQLWLNRVYPNELRKQIKSLEISGEWLRGPLDLTNFVNLEELYCYDNKLTGIKLANSLVGKLRVLHVGNNDFPKRDLSFFSHFTALEVLNLENNNFTGSLQFLAGLVNLQSLDISDTDITGGLNYLPKNLKSLFCRVEKKVGCQMIKEELKHHHLGHDCYDFPAWRKIENLVNMPGSWYYSAEENSEEGLYNLAAELSSQEENFLSLASDIYHDLILVEREESNIAFSKKNLGKFRNSLEEMLKPEEKFNLDSFRSRFKFNPHDLVLVAERYIVAKEQANIWRNEEENKKLRQNNALITKAKDELLSKTLCEIKKYQDDIASLQNLLARKKEEITELEETIIGLDEIHEKIRNEKEILQTELTKQNEEIIALKEQIKKILKNLYNKYNNNKKIITNMTEKNNNNNPTSEQKVFILEWKGAELKEGTMRYEKFAVIAGSEQENLSFYSTFFTDNIKFKKGDIYQLSTAGSLVQDSSEIVQGISNGSHEFEKSFPSLLIKELWEANQENIAELDLLKREFEDKKKDYDIINEKLLGTESELSGLKSRFDSLQIEKNSKDKSLEKIEKELASQKEESEKKAQQLVSFKSEIEQLKSQLSKLQSEKNGVENERITQERYMKLLQEKESLKNELKTERKKRQSSDDRAEEFVQQRLSETIETKLQAKKNELQQLKFSANNKLGSGQEFLLGDLLEKNDALEWMLFENTDQKTRTFTQAQKKLQEAKDNLIGKLDVEEIEEICQMQTEIIKLENSQAQWEKMEEQQEGQKTYESFESVPPKYSQ